MYSAIYTQDLKKLLPWLDGVHYTIHEKDDARRIDSFLFAQNAFSSFPEKSFRLFVHKNVAYKIPIIPVVWSRIEIKDWEADCKLPENEQLYVLGG
jgi:hypothetical protein